MTLNLNSYSFILMNFATSSIENTLVSSSLAGSNFASALIKLNSNMEFANLGNGGYPLKIK
jgi:hypothetical protein